MAEASTATRPEDRRATREHRRRPLQWRLVLGLPILLVVLAGAIVGPLLGLPDPLSGDISLRLRPPGSTSAVGSHLLGTDALGRDILSRLVHGARVSVTVGLLAVGLATAIGVTLGLIAGYRGHWADALVMRATDLQLGIPTLVLVIALVAAIGPGFVNVVIALSIGGWVVYARLVRGETLAVREREYVEAARTLGAGSFRIMARHVLPNVRDSIIVVVTLQVPQMILTEASLSFLGLGVIPPVPTWGNMVADGRNYLSNAWWVTTVPGLTIAATALALNLVGDWLRDALSPRRAG